jgi:chromosome partitioning protein
MGFVYQIRRDAGMIEPQEGNVGFATQTDAMEGERIFREIMMTPSIEKIHQLSPSGFEHFIEYLFQYAGYEVEYTANNHRPNGQGFDLHLYQTSLPSKKDKLYVECRRYGPSNQIDIGDIDQFIGKLAQIGPRTSGYFVTTSTFNGTAQQAIAKAVNHRVIPIDGDHLIRYIHYLNGSQPYPPKTPLLNPISPHYLLEAEGIARRPLGYSTVVAVCSNKGGVGKTTTSLNLGFALASPEHHQRVLFVDMDGQANLSDAVPGKTSKEPSTATIAEYFRQGGRVPLRNLMRATSFPNIWILSAHPDMLKIDTGGSAQPAMELQFVRDLHDPALTTPEGDHFDWIIIDTPTTQSLYTRCACAAAHYALIPTRLEHFGAQGLANVIRTLTTMKALTGKSNQLVGSVITFTSNRIPAKELHLHQDIVNNIAAKGGRMFMNADRSAVLCVPQDVQINKAHLGTIAGKTRTLFHQQSPATKAYLQLAREVTQHVHDNSANA